MDVLLITALKDEYDAVRAVLGPDQWTDHDIGGETPYASARFRSLSVALARPVRMGGRSTGPLVARLTDRFQPACLAMCGVCAGNPGDTALGDVVVAELAYEWDEGKHTGHGFLPAPQQVPQDARWVRRAQDFDPSSLWSYGAATEEEAEVWFLERLLKGQDPRRHPARRRYFAGAAWDAQLESLESRGLIVWQDDRFALTDRGAKHIQRVLYSDAAGPRTLPFAVLAGPMASGSAVLAAPEVWVGLEAHQRDVLALDMEAATIATVANDRRIKHWLVAKGVSDHADPHKDDRFKAFAARASAEVLFALLGELLEAPPAAPSPQVAVPGPIRQEVTRRLRYHWPDLADVFGVPAYETRRFRAGDEPHDLWAWLEQRHRLPDLPDALDEIGLADLAALLRAYV